MAVPGREIELPTLARHLVENGPHKTLQTQRRVRILINGACIADTIHTSGALFVWEHPYYPQLYLPKDALLKNVQGYTIVYENHQDVKDSHDKLIAQILKVKVTRKSDNNMKEVKDGFMVFSNSLTGKASILSNMLKVHFSAAGELPHVHHIAGPGPKQCPSRPMAGRRHTNLCPPKRSLQTHRYPPLFPSSTHLNQQHSHCRISILYATLRDWLEDEVLHSTHRYP
jgi:hypothetical protein